MLQLINDILDFSKIEAGMIELNPETYGLRKLLATALSTVGSIAAAKGVGLVLTVEEDVPEALIGDCLRLRQILLNLLSNAVKFTANGSVTLTAACTPAGMLRLTVRDSGIGIAEDKLDAIFNDFQQADERIAKTFGGTGLGLAISRRLARLMGGDVTVESVLGEGSSFTLTVPLVAGDPAALEEDGQVQGAGDDLAGRRLLFAEDNDINASLLRSMMRGFAAAFDIVGDGQAALDAVLAARAAGAPYDLLFLDLQMPVMDGVSAARAIRAAGVEAGELPIIALTANAFPEDVARVKAAGMQAHLAKPLRVDAFRETVHRHLRGAAGGNGSATSKRAKLAEMLQPGHPLYDRYAKTRDELLDRLGHVTEQTLDSDVDRLLHELHGIAGTAAMFGEAEFGQRAHLLEHDLRAEATPAGKWDVLRTQRPSLDAIARRPRD